MHDPIAHFCQEMMLSAAGTSKETNEVHLRRLPLGMNRRNIYPLVGPRYYFLKSAFSDALNIN